jgi:putative ABC transport system permease protein
VLHGPPVWGHLTLEEHARPLSDRIGVAVGDQVTLLVDGAEATTSVVGFVDEPLGTYAYASLDVATSLLGTDAAAPQAPNLRFAPGADRTAMLGRIEALDGVATAIDARALARAPDSLMGLFYAFVGAMPCAPPRSCSRPRACWLPP